MSDIAGGRVGEAGSGVRQAVPAELSSFIGRERELTTLASLLATERLVMLTGPAGIGKTRLAVRTVRTLGDGEGLDVVWADLAALPERCWDALAAELAERLAGRAALLVLDGCEQLGEAGAGLVAELLRLPGLRILATSQRRLRIAGEAVLAVPPLSVPTAPSVQPLAPAPSVPPGHGQPEPARRFPVADVAGYAAVRLFEERARGADPFFELTDRNAAAVAALCRALDGIPGALELAAGRSHQYAPAQALRRLGSDPLGFLAGGAGRSTRVDAERSLRLASPAERLLWERLSVFAGSFDRAAVAEVCGFGALTPDTAVEALLRLAPGLLADAGQGRYRLPLSVRAYAARRLAHGPAGDGATTARRHRERSRVVAERAARLWRAGAQREARALALRELPELRAAMNPLSAGGPGAALEIAVSLWFLWTACGMAAEGRRHVERALAVHPAPRPARALWLAAWLVAAFGESDGADPLLVEAWTAAVYEGEDTCLAYLAHLRGTIALWEGRYEAAAEEYREGLELLPADPGFGPGRHALRAAHTLAVARTDPAAVPVEEDPRDGRPDGSQGGSPEDPQGGSPEDSQRGSQDSPAPADLWARSWLSYAHALVQRHAGRPARARDELLSALRTQFALDDTLGQAFSVELLAELEADQGRYAEAARLLGAVSRTRPRAAPAPRVQHTVRTRLTPQAFRAAYTSGARTPLRELLPELAG
ncbi:ATP-binding protein [Streptomyces sp. NPDC002886]|uniref:ATP-binding protein n=1 Tax=Streptomyces sp. NPDC002886 TaxID=3364667 RepID=UPI0036A756C7